jgi:hypothetical protein
MNELSLPPETLLALKTRHKAFLAARLVSEQARADWARSLREGYAWWLARSVRNVLDPAALTSALGEVVSKPTVRTLVLPITREVHRRVLALAKADGSRVGTYVPDDARRAITALVERNLVPASLVRNVLEQEAIEDTIRDILYEGLREFNETVNPFFAEWGLPAILKRMPIGGGTLLKSMGALRGEFDKRLDPEIRQFLLVFSQRASVKVADLFVKKASDAKFVALRTNVVEFLYTQTVCDLLASVDDAARTATDTAIGSIVLASLDSDATRKRVEDALSALLSDYGEMTVGAALQSIGASGEPDFEALANLVWPTVKSVLESPVARAFFDMLTDEFYEGLV